MDKVAAVQRAMQDEVAEIKRIETGKSTISIWLFGFRVPKGCVKQTNYAREEEWKRDGYGWI